MNKAPDIQTQLMGLKALFEQFGVLHELQIQQLKRWSWAIDPNTQPSPELEIDIENRKIIFNLTCDKVIPVDQTYKDHIQDLLYHVRFMLGETWAIKIVRNLDTIFDYEDCVIKDGSVSSNKRRDRSKKRSRNSNRSRRVAKQKRKSRSS